MRHGRIYHNLARVPKLIWVLLLTLVCLVPFLNKAFFIDDTLFLRAAEQIQKHPLDFYGFKINWFGYTTPMTVAFENPPLTSYYIAAVASVIGWSEPALHLAFLLPALAAIWGTFRLASHYCAQPWLAAAIALLTPAFLVSATTVMCDAMLLAFWVWSLVCFEEALQKNSVVGFITSGCLAGLAIWTKFPGLSLVPLVTAYGICKTRRAGWWLAAPMLPLAFAAAYEGLTALLYGHGLLFHAAKYASKFRADGHESPWEKMVIGLAFAGGCFLPAVFYAPLTWSRRAVLAGVCALVACLLFLPGMPAFLKWIWVPNGGLNWGSFCYIGCLVVAGASVLVLPIFEFSHRRDPVSFLLILWISGIFVFTFAVNWTINARSLLPAVPALGILLARRLESVSREPGISKNGWPKFVALFFTGAASLLIAKSDFNVANAHRTAATELFTKYKRAGRTVWFEGHWGLQYYLEELGAKALETRAPRANNGDILISPEAFGNTGLADDARLIEEKGYDANWLCTTMNNANGAGFYAASIGPLPFSFGRSRPEYFNTYEIVTK